MTDPEGYAVNEQGDRQEIEQTWEDLDSEPGNGEPGMGFKRTATETPEQRRRRILEEMRMYGPQ